MIYQAYVKGGDVRIVGQVDAIPTIARLDGFDAKGVPGFSGGSDVIWDEQAGDNRLGLTWWSGDDGELYPSTALELRAVDAPDEIAGDVSPIPFPTHPTRLRAEHALRLLREARDILKEIGAPRAADRVREAISSADGAVRAASVRDERAAGGAVAVRAGAEAEAGR